MLCLYKLSEQLGCHHTILCTYLQRDAWEGPVIQSGLCISFSKALEVGVRQLPPSPDGKQSMILQKPQKHIFLCFISLSVKCNLADPDPSRLLWNPQEWQNNKEHDKDKITYCYCGRKAKEKQTTKAYRNLIVSYTKHILKMQAK